MFKNKWPIIILLLIAAGVAGFFIFKDFNLEAVKPTPNPPLSGRESSSSPDKGRLGVVYKTTELDSLKEKALDRTIPAGDAKITNELKDLSLQLSREPNYLQGWLQVGILRKFLKDYEGAILAWQYASVIRPESYIAFNNLADLYYYYLKDFPKAEAALLEGISKNPKNPNLIIFLATLYQDQGDKINTRKYYEEALKLNPPNKATIEQELAAFDSQ